jgi:hypothetical protein
LTSDEAVIAVIRALNAMGTPYMITGSLASNLFGLARSTKDADFLLETPSIDMGRLQSHLGTSLRIDRQMSFETVTMTSRYIIQKRSGPPFNIELFFLSNDEHDRSRFDRRRRERMFGEEVFVPTPEDVVITKLRWSKQGRRIKDVDDARNVLAVQGDKLDFDYIRTWTDRHGTTDLLAEIRRSLPAG